MKPYIGKDLEQVVAYCKTFCERDVKDTLKVANDVVKNTFLFESKWEMERTYEPVVFKQGEIKWDTVPFGDPEWMYAMNRHRCFITLAQAYALTKDEKYAMQWRQLLTQWVKTQPLTEKSKNTTWRTIETGLRCENWIKAYEIFKMSKAWDETLEQLLKESLKVHCEHILAHHDDFRRLSNWGVIENHGLFVAGIFLKEPCYIEVAKERLEKAIRLQVLEDGLHWEQSQLYHNEVLRAFVDVAICAKNNNIVLSENYHEIVQKMLEAHIHMTKPNRIQLANGDSDDMDLRDILVRGAYLYEQPIYKALGYPKADFESIWDIGMKGGELYNQLEASYPEVTSKALEASGNYCMRHSWEEDSLYVHFKCGNLGGGHGHVDLLHVDVAYLGEDILKDQGRYTYTNTKERFSLKEAAAHNTVVVDGKPFTKIIDTWGYGKVAPHVQRSFVSHKSYDYVEGAHLGYMDLKNPVFVNRKVIMIKPNIVVLMDEFTTQGEHVYEQYFHFGEGKLERTNQQVTFMGNKVQATLYPLQPVQNECLEGLTSKTYNQLQPQQVLRSTTKAKGNTTVTTVLLLEEKEHSTCKSVEYIPIYTEGSQIIETNKVEAIKIMHGDVAYTVVVKHDETYRRLMVVEGHDLYGRVNLIEEKNGQTYIHKIVG